MSILRSIYTSFATVDGEFNARHFVEAALLFDEIQFAETALLPQLIRATGVDGTLKLLNSGLVRVVGGGPNAQAKFDYKSPGFFSDRPAIFAPMNFGFETIYVDCDNPANPSVEERLARDIAKTKELISISTHELNRINEATLSSLQNLKGQSLITQEDFRFDLTNYQGFIIGTIIEHLAHRSIPIHVYNWHMAVEEVADCIYRVDTNLGKLLGIPVIELHELVKKPFFDITGTNLQLRRMRELNAAAGLSERQSAITANRLDFLSRVHIDADKRKDLTRIIELAEIPSLDPGAQFSAQELIELRNSDEARAFRDYLQQGGGLDEEEIKETVRSWRRKLGEKARTPGVRSLRWLASTGLGAVLPPSAGIAIGIVDQFLDKLLGDMGPIGFINTEYRRFISKQEDRNE